MALWRRFQNGECHCEERSDEAISILRGRLLRFARNDVPVGGMVCRCAPGRFFLWRVIVEAVSWAGMTTIIRLLYITGGLLFLASAAAYVYVRARLRPATDSDLDDYYYEFEDQHPGYARYTKWQRITLSGAALGVLLLFLGVVLF